MQKKGVMKEVKIDIQSELAMNIVNYLITEEEYIYVGNEREVWLENLSHPIVQLIYINQRNIFNDDQKLHLLKQIERVRTRIRRRYLMWRLNVVILNLDEFSTPRLATQCRYLKVIHINEAKDANENKDLRKFYPKLEKTTLERPMNELVLEMQQSTKQKALNVRNTLMFQKKAPVTLVFLGMLLAMFVFLQFHPLREWGAAVAIEFGAKYNPLILAGEYWRLLTSSLIHLDALHLIFNGVFIFQVGKMLEQLFGWWRMIILIIGSALMGNLFSFAFVEGVSLGASTVAYGLLGGLFFLGIENRKMFMHLVKSTVFPILGFSVLWMLIDYTVDGFSHIGGFIGGFLIASILGIPKYRRFRSRTFLASVTILLLVSGLFARGVTLTKQTDFEDYNMALFFFFIEQGKEERALQLVEQLDLNIESIR